MLSEAKHLDSGNEPLGTPRFFARGLRMTPHRLPRYPSIEAL